MRKMFAVALAALMVVVFAQPANAADGQHTTGWYSVHYDGTLGVVRHKETAAKLWWDTQADGTGVCVEFVAVDTKDGGWMLSGYQDVRARYWNSANGVTSRSWDWGQEPDDFTKDHGHVCGPDVGAMDYRLRMCGGDDALWWHWRIYASGGHTLIDKGHEGTNACGGGGGGD